MAKTNVVEAPPTPGRPVFSFSVGSRKNIPSKWDDAQKWLISGPDSPAHHHLHLSKHQNHKTEVPKPISVYQVPIDHRVHNSHGVSPSDPPDILLKDKLTNSESEEHQFSRFKCVVPVQERFLFSSMKDASTEMVDEGKRRCPTPYKSVSPPRHTTPASMSGPLALMNAGSSFDIAELHECHLAKLQLETPGTCNWSSREEEEEDVSRSLRHFEMNNKCPKTVPGPTACCWEEEQKARSHLRYEREVAKIEAWVNLENAKAEAESRRLEVKIQKMRSKFEEKMMKRMASVHRKAQELRAAAQYDHNNMQPPKSTKKSKDLNDSMHLSGSCACFPCSNHPL